MSEELHHVGDTGTAFRLTIKDYSGNVVPIETATTIKFSILKPNKVIVSKNGAFYTDGSDGIVQWITTSVNDLDMKGLWKIQVYVILPDGSWYTSKSEFQVDDNIVNY